MLQLRRMQVFCMWEAQLRHGASCRALKQAAVQIACEEASGGVLTSDIQSASRRLLSTLDIAATCIHDEVCNRLCSAFQHLRQN